MSRRQQKPPSFVKCIIPDRGDGPPKFKPTRYGVWNRAYFGHVYGDLGREKSPLPPFDRVYYWVSFPDDPMKYEDKGPYPNKEPLPVLRYVCPYDKEPLETLSLTCPICGFVLPERSRVWESWTR